MLTLCFELTLTLFFPCYNRYCSVCFLTPRVTTSVVSPESHNPTSPSSKITPYLTGSPPPSRPPASPCSFKFNHAATALPKSLPPPAPPSAPPPRHCPLHIHCAAFPQQPHQWRRGGDRRRHGRAPTLRTMSTVSVVRTYVDRSTVLCLYPVMEESGE
jgi:hypothetical protein